jgi:hypothetical protein
MKIVNGSISVQALAALAIWVFSLASRVASSAKVFNQLARRRL